jgi:hypothetical protein
MDGNDFTLDVVREGIVIATISMYRRRMGAVVIEEMSTFLNDEDVSYMLFTPSTVVDITNLDAYIEGHTWMDPISGEPEIDNGQPTFSDPQLSESSLSG